MPGSSTFSPILFFVKNVITRICISNVNSVNHVDREFQSIQKEKS